MPYGAWTRHRAPLPRGWAFGTMAVELADESACAAKHRALNCYASQHPMLARPGEDFLATLDSHSRARGAGHGAGKRGEALWPVMACQASAASHGDNGQSSEGAQ
jgi:hypothetical protein